MLKNKPSFFDRMTDLLSHDDSPKEEVEIDVDEEGGEEDEEVDADEDDSEGELTIDMYQTPSEIIVQTMAAGVKPDDLDINITRDMVTIKGKRERSRNVTRDDYFFEELYWGSFSRTIVLPEEVEVEESEASFQNGLLTIRLPKIDKKKTQRLKVKPS
ncbi:MAG: Hsp20/alpha crystallin family protein [Parcubacteria group bacterium]|nr:Hsp20/alpha crystallin family protein [Parcubacteria group bacterium]